MRRKQYVMAAALSTYLQDHLAGAGFAIGLLEDMRGSGDESVRTWAARLQPEIEKDRTVLQALAEAVGEGGSPVKESTAWVAQKASRLKLTPGDAFGTFEAVEVLSLGILGKLALWRALRVSLRERNEHIAKLDLDDLEKRAVNQHNSAEQMRLSMARIALTPDE
jgi:hypothetical protein